MATLRQAIDAIIQKRKSSLHDFNTKKERFDKVIASAAEIISAKNEVLARSAKDETVKTLLGKEFIDNLSRIDGKAFKEKCDEFDRIYSDLYARYSKEEISISVIGEGRSGKSCLLQSISGLDSKVIPSSSSSKDCTGAVSVLKNDPNVDFRAEIVYYTAEEMLKNVNQYLEVFGLARLNTLSQISTINVGAIKLEMGDPNAGKLESLEKIVANYDKWIDGIMRYGQSGSPRIINDKNQLMQYVAQHNGLNSDEPGYESYYEYLAVKHVVITCCFNYPDAGRIVLRDTVGLGDVRAIGLEEAMMDSISQDCDAAMVVIMPAGNKGYRENEDRLYRRLKASCDARGMDMDKWFFYVINHTAETSGYGDNIALCNDVKDEMERRKLLMAESFIVDVSSKDEVRDELLIPILEMLKKNLPELDVALEKQLNVKAAEVYDEYAKLLDMCKITAESYSPDKNRQMSDEEFKRDWSAFTYDAGTYLAEYKAKSEDKCTEFETAINGFAPEVSSIIPSVEQIDAMLHVIGPDSTPVDVMKNCMHRVRNELTKRFIDINELFDSMVHDMQRKIANLLSDRMKMYLLLDGERKPDETVVLDAYADLRREIGGSFPEINEGAKYAQWLMEIYVVLDNKFKDDMYNDIKMAVKFISEFNISVRSFLIHRVRKYIDMLDPLQNNMPLARVVTCNSNTPGMADTIYYILRDLYTTVFSNAQHAIRGMYKEPNQLIYAAVSEFVDRTIYSFFLDESTVNPITGEKIIRLEKIERAWYSMCCNHSLIFRRNLEVAKQKAELLNAKFRELIENRIPKESFSFVNNDINN